MYVTPRPTAKNDPHYALRLGLIGALAYLAVALLNPALPPIITALPIGLIGAHALGVCGRHVVHQLVLSPPLAPWPYSTHAPTGAASQPSLKKATKTIRRVVAVHESDCAAGRRLQTLPRSLGFAC